MHNSVRRFGYSSHILLAIQLYASATAKDRPRRHVALRLVPQLTTAVICSVMLYCVARHGVCPYTVSLPL